MAYAAVISLKHTIDFLLISPHTSFASSTLKILELAYKRVELLRHTLEKFDVIKNMSKEVMDLEAQIGEEARRIENAIESHVTSQFLSQSEGHVVCSATLTFSLNLDELKYDVKIFAKRVKKMKHEYIKELYKPCREEEDAATAAVVSSATGGNECDNMVGLSDQFLMIREKLIKDVYTRRNASISGMAGIGKTTLAKKIFNDSLIKAQFECRAFVTVGRKYQLEEILQALIDQVNHEMVMKGDEDSLATVFYRCLNCRKYLIVFDDIWDVDFFRIFEKIQIEESNGVFLLVSRETRIVKDVINDSRTYVMRFLDEEESWVLLSRKVFGEEEECPSQLVKAGRKIAKNCEGLPLLIVIVAQQLFEAPKNLEYWNEVAEKQNSVFEDANDEVAKVLLPSYHYLPRNLKTCFLYMAAFSPDNIVRRSRITNLWNAEVFLENTSISLRWIFEEFISTNLVVVCQRGSVTGRVKACRLHSTCRHLIKKEVENNKFLCILNSYEDGSNIERVQSHCRLAIYNNVLFAIKEVHNTIASISTVRSLLCTGAYHQYQVTICLEHWRLLRVIDALTIRFYEFPVDDGVKLINLSYLALTCNANLPRSITQLWSLEYLIVHQHSSIKRAADESYLPVEIWDLQGLRHLQIMGRNLPDPPPGAVLRRLKKLLDVGVQSCTAEILGSIPYLKKLRIRIELAPQVVAQTLSCFDHISCLDELKSLQSVVVNPILLCEPIVRRPPLSVSMTTLKKLVLSGFGYPWKDTSSVAELPYLALLKLQCYAFRGEKWEVEENGFSNLEYLLIEDTDLVQWTAEEDENTYFPKLSWLTMKNCHKLQEIPRFSSHFINIELIDCNPLAETCAKQRNTAEWVTVTANHSWK